ncbi:MAG: STAS domain-containing protein [Candidatus Solibacter sp.]
MLQKHGTETLVRLSGEATVGSAAALKAELLEALASGGDVQVDLQGVEAVDLATMQLIWAAAREAAAGGRVLAARVSCAVECAAQELGFGDFAGTVQDTGAWPK